MFELANPWFLLAWLLPLLLWYLLPRAQPQLPAALKLPFYQAISSMIEHEKSALIKRTSLTLPMLVWFCAVLALAGPRWVGEPRPLTRESHNIMMALDLSGSMEINDMMYKGRPASRLDVVKHAAEQFVTERSGDKIGLILFGSRAYLLSPLTYDRHSVLMRIEDATAGLAGKTTSLGDALGLAVKRLQHVPPQGRIIILLTDGANNSGILQPLKAAELAKADGIKVYTIGLGADVDPRVLGGAFLLPNAAADLDEDSLKQIAKMTGGQYFRATDSHSLQKIYQTINQLETIKQDQATVTPRVDYYPWPLGLALILLFIWMGMQTNLIQGFQPFLRQKEGHLRYDN